VGKRVWLTVGKQVMQHVGPEFRVLCIGCGEGAPAHLKEITCLATIDGLGKRRVIDSIVSSTIHSPPSLVTAAGPSHRSGMSALYLDLPSTSGSAP
jgi:hypothetical protein